MRLKILSDNDITKIHEAALDILENTGVYFWGEGKAKEIMKNAGCTLKDGKVLIPRTVVEHALKALPDRNTLKYFVRETTKAPFSMREGETHISLIGNSYYYHDYEKNVVLEATNEICEDKDVVLNNLENITLNNCNVFILPGHEHKTKPFYSDLDSFDNLKEFLLSRVNRRGYVKNRAWYPSIRVRNRGFIRLELLAYGILEGYEGIRASVEDDMPFVWVNPISPLQYNGDQCDRVIEAAKKKNAIIQISPECMMGSTSPITIAGTLLQTNAEILGMVTFVQLVNPGTGCVYGNVGCSTDLRNMDVNHGSFETQMINVGAVQMADFYGLPSRVSSGCTSAAVPGPRALSEQAVGLFTAMSAGANIITTGLLNSTLTLSLEHIVAVNDLVAQFKGSCQGIDMSEEMLARKIIHEEGHPSPNYLTNDFTVGNLDSLYLSPFTGRVEMVQRDVYETAHEKVKSILEMRYSIEKDGNADAMRRLECVLSRLSQNRVPVKSDDPDWWKFYCQDFAGK